MTSAFQLPGQATLDLGGEQQLELDAGSDDADGGTRGGAREEVRQSIDDLVREAQRYRSSSQYAALLNFAGSMRRYSPYNALLADIQKPGSRFLATASQWRERYQHRVSPDAQPIVFLRPGGPVMFVYDVSDVEPLPDAQALPQDVRDPFGVRFHDGRAVEQSLQRLQENISGIGMRVSLQALGSTHAAHVSTTGGGVLQRHWPATAKRDGSVEDVPLRYDAVVNTNLHPTARFTSLVHEVAHVLCGHLGSPDLAWWPSRDRLAHGVEEFEAESVAYVVARRLDSDVVMPPYLHQHLDQNGSTPDFSLERVVKVSGDVDRMCTARRPTPRPGKALSSR